MSVDQHTPDTIHIQIGKESKGPSEIELGLLQMQTLWVLSRQPTHGYDLMKSLSVIKGTEITQGTLYPMLKRLQELGMIRSEAEGRRIVNHITDKGKKTMNEACLGFVKTFYGIFHDYACQRCDFHNKKGGGCNGHA